MKCCIKCHKFNKYFKFILLTSLLRYFNVCFLGYNFNHSFIDVSLPSFLYFCFKKEIVNTEISNFRMIEFFFNYIGTFVFSMLFRIYELKVTQERFDSFFKLSDSFAQAQIKIGQLIKESYKNEGEIAENILSKFKNYLLKNNSIGLYIIISIIWVLDEIIMIVLFYQFKDVDFWFLEILIATFIYSRIFLVQIYKHQIFAIILNLIPTFLKITCLILTATSSQEIDEKQLIYRHNKLWIAFGIIMHPILTAFISFINCTLKSFLDLKYTTMSQLLIFYSVIGIIISFIICIISTFYPCSTNANDDNNNYLAKIMCPVKDNDYLYFDNFNIYFKAFLNVNITEKILRSLIIIFDSLTFFFLEIFLFIIN